MSEQEQKIIALIKSGMRAPEIAERLGCHPGTVYTTATRARLSTITGKTLDIEDKDKRIVQLYEQGLGPSIIVERMGVTKSAIRTAIARRNALRTGAA